MNRKTRIYLKTLAWIGCLGPLAQLGWRAASGTMGADPAARIASVTGLSALWLLAATLAITPVRKLVPQLGWLIQFRRLAGLFVFFYATLHLLTYVALFAGFDLNAIFDDVSKRRFIVAGVATWLVLLALAVTSTQRAIRRLGGRRWNRLHKLVYLAAVFALAHYWWKIKPGVLSPVPLTVVLVLLLAARLRFRRAR
ncbi:MAG: sulfoxide reductase heme-binding subunit YedZ [Terracidiphilus sp.]|nr:sulfoxide reductase heme-binding subunit YedZ [Terracidiphilus sp.]